METTNKKQFAAAVGLLLLSAVPIHAAQFYQTIQLQAAQTAAQTANEICSNLETFHQISLSMEQQRQAQERALAAAQSLLQEKEKRTPEDLNERYAKDAFDQLTELDESWLSNIYHSMQQGNFEKINLRVTDGDGKEISLYSNASAIMSLANVYAYYHNPDDTEEFLKHCRKLWQASHSYTLGISEPYYCSGVCIDEQDEEREDWGETLLISGTPSNADSLATSSDAQAIHPCPGHRDLNIHMKIIGINGKHTLFELASDELSDSWNGWNEQNIQEAHTLYEKDWYEAYGLTTSALALGNPLSLSEIETTMQSLPADLSESRRNIIRFALESVGKVPYYYGGKASRAGYEGNYFGSQVTEDQSGRILKGLDCSGWIGWVYWSAAGMEIPYATTFTLSSAGTQIEPAELKPGDILVRTGKDAHTVMFLEWTEDGKMRCIHESSTAANNVIISVMKSSFPICRRLLDE